MQSISVPLFVLLTSSVARSQDAPVAPTSEAPESSVGGLLDPAWSARIHAEIDRAEYGFSAVAGESSVWSAPNRSHALRSRVSERGLELFSRSTGAHGAGAPWKMNLRTGAFGRSGSMSLLGAASVETIEERAELDHGMVIEWFNNSAEGVEQGWTIESRPAGTAPLRIELVVEGGFEFRLDADGCGGVLEHEDVEIPYRGLVAFDANGATLEARLEETTAGLAITVDDEHAVYPVIVDPVLTGPAWTTEANQASASYGSSVAIVGDVNGDGYDDIAVGAPFYDAGETNEGRVWLFYGSASGPSQSSNWFGSSNQEDARFGEVVSAAGDVNGDGFDDMLISAPRYDNGEVDEGLVWGYYGSPTGLPSGSSWFFDGDQVGAQAGTSVAAAGDVNGDGYDDIIIGAPWHDDGETNEGRVFAFYGTQFGLPNASSWFASSNQAWAMLGHSVAGAGDFDNDGYDDVLIAAPFYDGPEMNEGRVWRFDGSASGLPAGSSWYAESDQAGSEFGFDLAGVGDVNDDGYDDIVIGAPYYDAGQTNEGRAWLFLGNWTNPTGSAWYRDGNQDGARFGEALAGAGDVNGDGYDDLVVGAPSYDSGQENEGRAWVHLGTPSGLTQSATWTDEGDQAFAWFGIALAGGGDVNGDGYSDVVIGSPGYDAGESGEGRAFAYTGTPFLGTPYCLSTLNSTGSAATISVTGSPSAEAGSLLVEAGPVPDGPAIFIHAPNQVQSTFGNGFLCVGGTIVRGEIVVSANNLAQYTYDNSTVKRSLGDYAGATRNFQAWFRDPAGGGANFDLSDAISVMIYP